MKSTPISTSVWIGPHEACDHGEKVTADNKPPSKRKLRRLRTLKRARESLGITSVPRRITPSTFEKENLRRIASVLAGRPEWVVAPSHGREIEHLLELLHRGSACTLPRITPAYRNGPAIRVLST